MARPRTIDREQLLDAAERIVAAKLSFGSVAEASGLSKASVQSVFGTREALIDAMIERWLTREQQRFDELTGERPSPRARTLAHMQTTEEACDGQRVTTLQATLAGSGEQSASTARWYAARIGDLAAKTPEQRLLRIAFLAAEGAFYMRHLVGYRMSRSLWRDIFKDLRAFVSE
jgi:AcrR family transcriptional regulator